jgi:uncharacterized glyoxalase superfamily protein PhnB
MAERLMLGAAWRRRDHAFRLGRNLAERVTRQALDLGIEMARDGYIMVGSEWADFIASPASVGGKNTQTIHVHLNEGIDAHCERARAAGATIIREPADQFYGDRSYMAKDPEGHVWSFAQTVRYVTREEAEKASRLKIEGWI